MSNDLNLRYTVSMIAQDGALVDSTSICPTIGGAVACRYMPHTGDLLQSLLCLESKLAELVYRV